MEMPLICKNQWWDHVGIDQLYYRDDTQYAGHIRGKYKHINLKQIENMNEKNPAIYRNTKYVGSWCKL